MKDFIKYSMEEVAELLNVSPVEAYISKVKALMTVEIKKTLDQKKMTHQNLADLSGIPRSAVTGILSGSLQKVSVDRLLKMMEALGKKVEFTFSDVV